MIDFIRFRTSSIEGLSEAQEHFITENAINHDFIPLEKMSKGCWKLKKRKEYCEVEGSLHNFYENDVLGSSLGNSTDFTLSMVTKALENLSETQNIDLYEAKPTNLEFGYNLELNSSVRDYLDSFTLYKEKAPYKCKYNRSEEFKSFKMSEYEVKCYNKGLHKRKEYEERGLAVPDNLLRMEVRYYSNQLRKRLKIESLGELAHKEVLEKLHEDFMDKILGLQVIDAPLYYPESIGLSIAKFYQVQQHQYWNMRRNKGLDPSTISKEKKKVDYSLKKCCSKKKGFLLSGLREKHLELMNN